MIQINSSVFKPIAIIKSSVNQSISSPSPKAEIEIGLALILDKDKFHNRIPLYLWIRQG